VYLKCDPASEEMLIHGEPGRLIVLWDTETGQALVKFLVMDAHGETSIWSLDGGQFITLLIDNIIYGLITIKMGDTRYKFLA
jgi:hypothetical protein